MERDRLTDEWLAKECAGKCLSREDFSHDGSLRGKLEIPIKKEPVGSFFCVVSVKLSGASSLEDQGQKRQPTL